MPWTDHSGPVPRRSQAELLAMARQKANAAAERSRRQLRALSGVAALVLVVGLGTVVDRTAEAPATELRTTSGDTAQPSLPPTTGEPAASTVTTSAPPAAPPARPTSTVTSRPPGPSTPTSRPAPATPATSTTLVCRNSFEPACGPFRWDPAVPPNQPLTVKVTVTPATPKVGDTVVFRVVVDDPDGSMLLDRDGIANNYGDAPPGPVPTAHRDCLERWGPWTPGAPQPVHADLTFRHVYTGPGTYVASFPFKALGDCTFGPSEATGSVAVTVSP